VPLVQSCSITPRLLASIRIFALGIALSSTSPLNAADITIQHPDAWGRIVVDIVGEIVAGDDKAFEQRVAAAVHWTPTSSSSLAASPPPGLETKPAAVHSNLVIVSLSSPGGDFSSAINISEFIHNHRWSTYVPSGTVCASSCATIWLAGDHRIIEGAPGVHIGFHAVFDAGTNRETGAGNAILGSHLARWGFDDRAITCVTITPPDQIGWLTGPDGSLCNITWEVLAPARTTPMTFWQPAQTKEAQPQTPSVETKTLRLSLLCSPRSPNNSSVVQIEVGLSVAYDPNPRIIYFDAWHSTTDGHVYKRSEQYSDRRFEIPNIQNRWIWKGRRWVQDQYFNMVQLSMNSRHYFYGEWNESTSEQLTDASCDIRPQRE
jgi:hypothetical protein